MFHKILNHPYEISKEYFNISEFDPRNHEDTKYRKLLLHTLCNIPSIVTLKELYRINLFFTRLQEDAQGRPITNLDANELEQYLKSLQKIYGNNIPNIFYHKETTDTQGVLSVKWTWVLSDMGIVTATRYKMDKIKKTPCRYNTRCTNKEEEHRALFTHPNDNKMGGRISRRKMHRFRKTRLAIRKRTRNTLRKHRQ